MVETQRAEITEFQECSCKCATGETARTCTDSPVGAQGEAQGSLHKDSQSAAYAAAGVDITAGYRSVELIKSHIARTKINGVLSDIGGFASLFELDLSTYPQPLLVAGTDGVGTKLKYAFALDKHDSIGIDCVAMCVNDVICTGAKPLYFLDYIACGKNKPEKIEQIVKGVSTGCIQAGCALVGGETAEMPGFYPEDEYDLAGFVTGVVNKPDKIQADKVEVGDILVALASSGPHSNGYSLLRKLFPPKAEFLRQSVEDLQGKSLADCLLAPTKIYVKPILRLLAAYPQAVSGMSHITGGGFYENIPRMLPAGRSAFIKKDSVRVTDIFKYIQKVGAVSERDMYNTFNMGVGFCLAVKPAYVAQVIDLLQTEGETAYVIGEVGLDDSCSLKFV